MTPYHCPDQDELDQAIADLQWYVRAALELESFSYPYEVTNASVTSVVSEYHRYARGGDQGVLVPPNPRQLSHAEHRPGSN